MCSNGGWGTGGSNQKVPDARKARASQDPTGMTLAEVPHKGEEEPVHLPHMMDKHNEQASQVEGQENEYAEKTRFHIYRF